MINAQIKTEIKSLLEHFVEQFPSQSKALSTIKGVSPALCVQILQGNWNNISDKAWTAVGKQVGWNMRHVELVETQDVRTMVDFFKIAAEEGANFAMIGNTGSGKTFTASWYAAVNRKNSPVYHVKCSEYWNKKMFLAAILSSMGVTNTGWNVSEMMNVIVSRLRREFQPLLIIDEFDKLKDEVLYFYITLYNELHGFCGIVLLGTDYLSKRINRGVQRNTKGYKEIFSRIGSKFITLDGTDENEVSQICKAHGITAKEDIKEICNIYEGDLRVIDRQILKKKLIASRSIAA